jgi:hypothetical protein
MVSLWQVYPDVGSAMTPHLIVMFDDLVPGPRRRGRGMGGVSTGRRRLVDDKPGGMGDHRERRDQRLGHGVQGWHLVEHTTLHLQAILGSNLFGSPVPTSFLQPFISRPELHLVYSLVVFIPMIVAVWLHTRPSQDSVNDCTCAAPPVRAATAGMASA